MKAETAQFGLDRVKRAGTQPVYLWNFTNAVIKASSIPLTVSGITTDAGAYTPLILSFDEIDFSLEDGNNFGSVGQCRVTLARNATTNALFAGSQVGTSVRVNLGFYKGIAIPDTDLMPMARFVFGGISDITQAQFTITLFNDERKLKPLPISRFTEVSIVPEENRATLIPLALGRFNAPAADSTAGWMFSAKGHDYIPCVLADNAYNVAHTYSGVARTDIGELVVSENKVGPTSTPIVNRLYQYDSALDTFSMVRYSTNDPTGPTSVNVFNTWIYANTSGDTFLPGSVNAGRLRLSYDRYMTRLIEAEHSGNMINDYTGATNFNWKNLADDSNSNVTRVQAGQAPDRQMLRVRWDKRGNPSPLNPAYGYLSFIVTNGDKVTGGGTRIRLKHGRVDTGALDVAFTSFDITGATTFPVLFFIHYNTAAVSIAGTTFGAIGWNWDNIFIQLETIGVGATTVQFAELSTLGLELYYTDEQHNFKKPSAVRLTRRTELLGRERRKGVLPGWVDFYAPRRDYLEVTNFSYLASPDALIFADYTSASTLNVFSMSAQFNAPWMAAAILGDILGYAASEFDITQFNNVSDNFATNTVLSVYVNRDWEAADLLRNISFYGNLLLFYGGDGRWKIQPKWCFVSYTGQQTPVQFSDTSQTYIISNLVWATLEPQYNKFRLLYQFDYARNRYFSKVESDQSGTVPNGSTYPDIEGLFIRNSTSAAEWLQDIFVKYHNRRRRIVGFSTSLAASHLELGDFIKIDHKALPDNTPVYQITQIRYGSTSIYIRAMETHT